MRVFSFHILALFMIVFGHNLQAQNRQVFENQKLAADSAFEASDYTLALERYSDLVQSYSKAGLPKNEFYYLSLFRNLDCLIITKKFDEAELMQNEISTEVFDGDGKAYLANYHFLKAKLLFRGKRAYQESYNEYQRAYKIKTEESAPSELRAETAHELAVTLTRYLGKHDSAIYYYNRAISDYTELSGEISNDVANELGFMAQTYYFMREPDKNLDYLKKSVCTFAQVLDENFLLKIPESNSYDSLDVFYSGLVKELERPEILSELPKSSVANITNIGNGLIERHGNLALGEDYLALAMKLNIKFGNPVAIAGTSQGLAGLYYRRNQFQLAIDYYGQAEKLYLKAGVEDLARRDQLVWVYANKGFLFNTISEIDSSIKYLAKALEMRRTLNSEPHWTFSFLYGGMGSNAYASKDYVNALKYFEKSKYNQFPIPYQLSYLKAEAFREMDQPDSAFFHFRNAIATFQDKGDINYGLYLNTFGDFFLQRDQLDSALSYYDKSILANQPAIESTSLESLSQVEIETSMHPVILLQSLKSRALAFQVKFEKTGDKENLKVALEHYDLIHKLIAFIRTSFIQEVDNIQFYQITREVIEGALNAFQAMFENESDQIYLRKAFEMADIGRSQIILDAIKMRQINDSNVSDNLFGISQLKRDMALQREKLIELKLTNEDKEQIMEIEGVLLQIEAQLLEKLSEIKESQPGLYQYLSDQGTKISFKKLEEYSTNHNGTVIEFFWGKEALFVLSLNKEGIRLSTLKVDLEDLKERIDRFKTYIATPEFLSQEAFDQFTEDGRFIYESLFSGLPFVKAQESLILIPDGPLSNLPFEALLSEVVPDGTTSFKDLPYLIRQKKTEYLTSAAILLENVKTKPEKNLQDYAAWAPFSDLTNISIESKDVLRAENLGELPGSAKELKTLESLFRGQQYLGKEASEESFKAKANSAKIIHVATHGVINDNQPLMSNLLFSEADQKSINEDNRLYLFELYSLRLNTELAVLTACNTGSGKQEQGEGAISLARAFKYAGAKSVLMSLWLANDQSTSDIIGDFYRNLADEQAKGEALRNAKLKYLNQADNLGAHPFYWSHLILSGDSAPLGTTRPLSKWIWLILPLLILLILLFRRKKIIHE